jgi:peptidoglycan/LPS O-acetylase OafA/YrhL
MQRSPHHRDENIDAFRGVAILAVVAFHYLVRWEPPHSETSITRLSNAYPQWLSFGALGVELFFIVSGLVISMTLLRSQSWMEFTAKRVARLYPPYLFAVVVTTAVFLVYDPAHFRVNVGEFLVNLTMLAPLFDVRPVDGAYWSLVPELFFYAWAALSWILLKDRFAIGLVLVGVIGQVVSPFKDFLGDIFLADYMPIFLFGVALWTAISGSWRSTCLVGSAALCLYFWRYGLAPETYRPSLVDHVIILGGAAFLSVLLLCFKRARWGPLAWIGRISFSFYLIHQALGVTLIRTLKTAGASDFAAVGITLMVMIGTSWAMFKYIETLGQKLMLKAYYRTAGLCQRRSARRTATSAPGR